MTGSKKLWMFGKAGAGMLAAVAMLLSTGGCETSSPKPPLPPISSIGIDDPCVECTPIIDIHTHSFNARDIPVKHIALGRRDSWETFWIPDKWAKQFGSIILAETPQKHENHVSGEDEILRRAITNLESDASITKEKLRRSAKFQALQRALSYRTNELNNVNGTRKPLTLSPLQKLVIWAASQYAKDHAAGSFKDSGTLYEEVSAFLYDLTRSDEQLVNEQFYLENSTNIVFRVSHMMDMASTYGETEGGHLVPFDQQIANIDELQHHATASMTYFVAYNPFRDNQYPGESLRLVKEALLEHHAYGVKVYPPAGYSVVSNQIPRRPGTCWHVQPAQQWDSRYTHFGYKLTAQELDARLLDLLGWCASNKVPVFVHCMDSEMQARAGYGAMAGPAFWRSVLESHPALTNLHLCLGHAGGEDWWYGDSTNQLWGNTVYYLCTHYANVYCEFGDFSNIFDPANQARFALNMRRLCTLSPTPEQPYPFGRKIMYGSDWFMPMAKSRKEFLKAFQQVFLWDKMPRVYYRLFFYENALNYLNAKERIDGNAPFPVDPYVKETLAKLVAKAED